MKLFHQIAKITSFALTIALTSAIALPLTAQAHLMVAQHGTLSIASNGVFMVLSLPISAFDGVDENTDGKVTMVEFNNHRASIIEAIRKEVRLEDSEKHFPLNGIMLSPVSDHAAAPATNTQAITQLTVMGKFNVANFEANLRFHAGLYGIEAQEAVLEITATRKTDRQKHVFELTPKTPAMALFSE